MFMRALFTIAKSWKQPKCPSVDEWIKKVIYIYIYISIHMYVYMKKKKYVNKIAIKKSKSCLM